MSRFIEFLTEMEIALYLDTFSNFSKDIAERLQARPHM